MRSIVNVTGASLSEPVYAAPPVLRALTVASPAAITVEIANQLKQVIPYGAGALLLKAAGALPDKRKEWHEGTGKELDNDLKRLELELKELELEQKRAEAGCREQIEARMSEIFKNSPLTAEEIARLINEHVLPPLRRLGETGVKSLEESTDQGDSEKAP